MTPKYLTYSKTDSIFCPREHQNIAIAEFDAEEFFNEVPEYNGEVQLNSYKIGQNEYTANFGNIRYHIFKNNRNCACCGIFGNRVFLTPDLQNPPYYHFNLYGENLDTKTFKTHFVLFTKDHVVPESKGGSEDISNFQTLCWNCNTLKADCNMELEQMKHALFPAYRAYRSTFNLNKAKEFIKPLEFQILRNQRAVENLDIALTKVLDERSIEMKKKRDLAALEVIKLRQEIHQICLDAQVKGIVPGQVNDDTILW